MNLSYEEFIKLIPEDTKKYVDIVLVITIYMSKMIITKLFIIQSTMTIKLKQFF